MFWSDWFTLSLIVGDFFFKLLNIHQDEGLFYKNMTIQKRQEAIGDEKLLNFSKCIKMNSVLRNMTIQKRLYDWRQKPLNFSQCTKIFFCSRSWVFWSDWFNFSLIGDEKLLNFSECTKMNSVLRNMTIQKRLFQFQPDRRRKTFKLQRMH